MKRRMPVGLQKAGRTLVAMPSNRAFSEDGCLLVRGPRRFRHVPGHRTSTRPTVLQ